MHILVRLIVNAVALLVTAWIVPGIHLAAARPHATRHDWLVLLVVALIFGVLNALIRPILVLLSLPITVLTLGLFIFVINAFMLLLTGWIAEGMGVGFRVSGFVPALIGSLIISVVSFVLTRVLRKAV
jgi:putative membrane protein